MSKNQIKTAIIILGVLAALFLVTFLIMVFNSSVWIKITSLFPFVGTMFLVYIEGWFSQKLYFKIKKGEKNGK